MIAPARYPKKIMSGIFSRKELELMKKLAAAGRRGRMVPGAARSGLARMVNKHYVKARPISPHMILYVMTDRGRQALADVME